MNQLEEKSFESTVVQRILQRRKFGEMLFCLL